MNKRRLYTVPSEHYDMHRMGIFREMSYLHGDPWRPPNLCPFRDDAYKGRQMYPGYTKSKAADQSGYFDEKFERVYSGEGATNMLKLRRQEKLNAKNKQVVPKPFVSVVGIQKPSGVSSPYGTFGGFYEHFSPVARSVPSFHPQPRNFITNPPKKGTGYGYVGITFDDYPPHMEDPESARRAAKMEEATRYEQKLIDGPFKCSVYPHALDENPYYSDVTFPEKPGPATVPKFSPFIPSSPGKKLGFMKAGTFDPYPPHSEDEYVSSGKRIYLKNVVNKFGKTFIPVSDLKSTPISSVMQMGVKRSITAKNYHTINTYKNGRNTIKN